MQNQEDFLRQIVDFRTTSAETTQGSLQVVEFEPKNRHSTVLRTVKHRHFKWLLGSPLGKSWS